MVPVSLTLKNLLSYGEGVPTLDFTPFHVACISGGNGQGKSALLDGITWALWGEARKPPGERKPDESLLRIGATDMRSDFEFDLEGDRYRVTRSYRKTGKGSASSLELQIFHPAAGYRTLSEDGSVRKTQARINSLLRMSYDTFTNAAFLLQGHADEFTRRSARERKTILAEILGLGRYDELAALARSHVQRLEIEAGSLRRKLEEIASVIAEKPDLQEKLSASSAGLAQVETHLADVEKQLESLRAEQSRVELHRKELEDLKANAQSLATDRVEIIQQAEKLQKEMAIHDDLIQKREQILAEADLFAELQTKEAGYRQKLEQLRGLESEQHRLEKDITQARHEVERQLADAETRVKEAEGNVAEAEEIVGQKKVIEEGLAELREQRDRVKTLEARREEQLVFQKAVADARAVLENCLAQARASFEALQNQRRPLEQTAAGTDARERELETAQRAEAAARSSEAERVRLFDEGNRCKARIDTIEQRKPVLEKEINERRRRRQELDTADGPECPLCGSELDANHRDIVMRELQSEIDALLNERADNQTLLATLVEERDDLRRRYTEVRNQIASAGDPATAVARADAALKEAETAQTRLAALDAELTGKQTEIAVLETESPESRQVSEAVRKMEAVAYDEDERRQARESVESLTSYEGRKLQLEAAEKKRAEALALLPEVRRSRDTARLYLDNGTYAGQLQEALQLAQEQIKTLAYDTEAHRTVSQEMERLNGAPATKERLLSAQRESQSAHERLAETDKRLGETVDRITRVDARTVELEDTLRASSQAAGDLATAVEAHQAARGNRDQRLQEHAALQTRLDRCKELESETAASRKQLRTADRTIRIYKELVTAFGKDGIQALLIEQAIPDIEEEANRILGRLTDNRTQISLESLRDLKKGGTRETLDIRISDELGERSYELYSGGEAFRVDFALRIALSRLLAHRAGTRLRTLVIDEGFGTQDTEGLDRLVEAIQSIRDDFEKILVITHVDALKNAFPVRIEVTKHPDIGSRYEIVA